VILAALVALPTLASAKDLTGRFGLGDYDSDAPIGMRYWFSPKLGLDLGLGYQSNDLGAENATNFFVDAGMPYVVVGTERANFFVRPSISYGMIDDRNFGTLNLNESWNRFRFLVEPGAEVFVGDHFSLEASHGFGVELLQAPDQYNQDDLVSFSTLGRGISELGFHFYF
jgi:hypothetical protein